MEIFNKMTLSVGTVYKRIFTSITVFALLIISLCTFTQYKICRFPFDVLRGPSQSMNEAIEKKVFIVEYKPIKKEIKVDTIIIKFRDVWIERHWFTKSYSNDIDPNSRSVKANHLVLKLEEGEGKLDTYKARIAIFNNDTLFCLTSNFSGQSINLSTKSLFLPDTLNLKLYKDNSKENNPSLFETLLIKQ